MKERVLHLTEGKAQKPPPMEPSGFQVGGWDKYHFFSDPFQATMLHPTAMKGRMRPAMAGPQTFNVDAFSAEDLAAARTRLGGKGAGTAYSESFSQIQIPPKSKATSSSDDKTQGLTYSASEPMLRNRTAAEILANTNGNSPLRRAGPHWPPTDGVRPDPIKTRANLMHPSTEQFLSTRPTLRM